MLYVAFSLCYVHVLRLFCAVLQHQRSFCSQNRFFVLSVHVLVAQRLDDLCWPRTYEEDDVGGGIGASWGLLLFLPCAGTAQMALFFVACSCGRTEDVT